MIGLGLVMTRIDAGAVQQSLYRIHVTLGLTVLVLTVFRLVWLVFNRWPPPPPGLSSRRKKTFKTTHALLYVLLAALVTTGVGMLLLSGLSLSPVSLSPAGIRDVAPREAHHLLSKLFIVLLVVHLTGVLDYQVRKGDALSRMSVRWSSRRA